MNFKTLKAGNLGSTCTSCKISLADDAYLGPRNRLMVAAIQTEHSQNYIARKWRENVLVVDVICCSSKHYMWRQDDDINVCGCSNVLDIIIIYNV